MDSTPTILIRGEKAPAFMAALSTALRHDLSGIVLKAADFETERLFMLKRHEFSQSGSCSIPSGGYARCRWELRSSCALLAHVELAGDGCAPGDFSLDAPGSPDVERKLRTLCRNMDAMSAKTSDGAFCVAKDYAEKVRSTFAECFDVALPHREAGQSCLCDVGQEKKVGLGAKFCLFAVIFFVPLVCLLWKILKEYFF